MIRLSTRRKLQIAQAASALALGARRLLGLPTKDFVSRRRGIAWEIDLSEGIDLAIYLFGRFELSTSRALARLVRPGMTVLDIGANIGAHALPMAELVGPRGRVYAIEPTRWAFEKMKRNLALNPGLEASLVPIQAALIAPGAEKPKGFYSSWSLPEKEGSHPVHGGTYNAASEAEFLTLDDLMRERGIDHVDFIKMDVDGYEVQALRGGEKTLARFHPGLIFELCPYVLTETGSSAEEFLALLRAHGYSFFQEDGEAFLDDVLVLKAVPEGGSLNLYARTMAEGPSEPKSRLVRSYPYFCGLVLALYALCVWDYAHSRTRLSKLIISSRSAVAKRFGAVDVSPGFPTGKACNDVGR